MKIERGYKWSWTKRDIDIKGKKSERPSSHPHLKIAEKNGYKDNRKGHRTHPTTHTLRL